MTKTKKTICPSPAYKPYRADLATRLAQEKAAAVRPAMISIASSVPSEYHARLDRSETAK